MGLDWVCLPKRKETNIDIGLLENQVSVLDKKLTSNFEEFCKALGEEIPCIYPNELTNQFDSLETTKELRSKIEEAQDAVSSYLTSPAETLGAPKLGVDKAADDWVKTNWDKLQRDESETVEDFIEARKGQYVLEAVKSPGMGTVTGIMTSPTSFRGKVLQYISWLDEDLVNLAFSDKDPQQLMAYGNELLIAAKIKRDEFNSSKSTNSDVLNDIELVEDAAKWCIFWGENGHPMHAWY